MRLQYAAGALYKFLRKLLYCIVLYCIVLCCIAMRNAECLSSPITNQCIDYNALWIAVEFNESIDIGALVQAIC